MAGMKLYDTLAGEKKELTSRDGRSFTMYTCGPTVYASTHIGHLIPPVVGDVLKRYLQSKGYAVRWAHNFTDVEDKIISRARELSMEPHELAQKYIDEYLEIMDCIGVDTVDVWPRVSEHIEDIVAAIEVLVEKGHAYPANGDVYFAVDKFPGYGKLSRRTPEELRAGVRVAVDEKKKSPADFALWKGAKPGEPSWPSPWGPGRPGWHIECSVMSVKHLGYPIDIHGGGIDLVFPHHENEVAQAEAHEGAEPFSRYWLHTGLLRMDAEKMSKSLGNLVTAKDVLDEFGPYVVRLFILNHHYRSPRDFSMERLVETRRAWERLDNAIKEMARLTGGAREARGEGAAPPMPAELAAALEGARTSFDEAMADDLNTAGAIAALFELVRRVNAFLRSGADGAHDGAGEGPDPSENAAPYAYLLPVLDFMADRGSLLGIVDPASLKGGPDLGELTGDLMAILLDIREQARRERDWELADTIRDRLAALGIAIEDTAAGPRVRMEPPGESPSAVAAP